MKIFHGNHPSLVILSSFLAFNLPFPNPAYLILLFRFLPPLSLSLTLLWGSGPLGDDDLWYQRMYGGFHVLFL